MVAGADVGAEPADRLAGRPHQPERLVQPGVFRGDAEVHLDQHGRRGDGGVREHRGGGRVGPEVRVAVALELVGQLDRGHGRADGFERHVERPRPGVADVFVFPSRGDEVEIRLLVFPNQLLAPLAEGGRAPPGVRRLVPVALRKPGHLGEQRAGQRDHRRGGGPSGRRRLAGREIVEQRPEPASRAHAPMLLPVARERNSSAGVVTLVSPIGVLGPAGPSLT